MTFKLTTVYGLRLVTHHLDLQARFYPWDPLTSDYIVISSHNLMHPCLEIPEIVFTIVELATIDDVVSGVEKVDTKTALALLTTSRNFTGHATQILWKNLNSLVPLLLAMPGGLLKRPEHVLNTMRPFTHPKPYEWSVHTVIVRGFRYCDS